MKPGKPLTFAEVSVDKTREDKISKKVLVFGLPGNPVSCLVCFHLFVVPAIRQLSGWTNPHAQRCFLFLLSYPFTAFLASCNENLRSVM